MYTKLAITIDIKNNTLDKYNEYLNCLEEKHNINFIKRMQYAPHLTLCVAIVKTSHIEELSKKIEKEIERIKPFSIMTNGLGVFIQEHIHLHIRWKIEDALNELKNSMNVIVSNFSIEEISHYSLNWIPKTTLAYKDINLHQIDECFALNSQLMNQEMTVQTISIVEVYEDRPEKIIRKLELNGVSNG